MVPACHHVVFCWMGMQLPLAFASMLCSFGLAFVHFIAAYCSVAQSTVYTAGTVDDDKMPRHQAQSIKEKMKIVQPVEGGAKKSSTVHENNLLLAQFSFHLQHPKLLKMK